MHSVVYITYDSEPSIMSSVDHKTIRKWFKNNGLCYTEWYNELDSVMVFGFTVYNEEDYVAVKLRWDECLL